MAIAVDAALCVLLLIVLIIGATKGFVKQFGGLLKGLVSLVGAIILTALIVKALQPTELYHSVIQGVTTWFSDETLNTQVSSAEQLAAVLSQHNTLKILSGLSGVLYADMQSLSVETLPCDTMAALLGHYVSNLIVGFVLWLCLLLLLRLIFKGIVSLMQDIITMPAFKTLDKILGAIWAIGLTYIILIGIIFSLVEAAILKFMPSAWDGMAQFIQQTTVLLWLHDTNILGELMAGILNVEIPSLQVSLPEGETDAILRLAIC